MRTPKFPAVAFFMFATMTFHSTLTLAESSNGENGNEAKAEAPAAVKEEPRSTVSPWVEVETKITELQAKIKSKEGNILKLLEEKNKLPNNSPQLQSTVKEIVKEHKEMRSLAADYQKNLSILRFRFPERNVKSGRKYDRIEVKSIEEMEQHLGIDGKLNRNLQRMRNQFKSEPSESVKNQQSEEMRASPRKPQKPESIEESGSIILQK